ncbi:ImuA family protein [Brytella acorum]|uniref:Damage-inducible protein n=1 Tax=Brytella acorum TaxID=2959299 RepID=A0AA35UXX9_9PROT|nr:damage-inducible protein [Brytella acorum]MDF3625990.1 damage-inducible protein [Brytella acorum]CAI9119195.1 damage-inducible protein [Brytella acorum]
MTPTEDRKPARKKPAVEALRATIARLEGHRDRKRAVLPFGMHEIDGKLPGGGLTLGALHEVAGGGNDALNAAAAALFAAGIAARTKGKVLWIVTRQDLFAPALDQAGLATRRVIHAEAGSETDALACFEEGLRHGGLGAVVAEVGRLTMTASRRLQIAAERTGTIGLAIRRWRRQTEAADFGQPTASTTRWRISVLPSAPLPVPGVERSRWLLELLRARSGECADFEVEGCDAKGRLCPAGVALPPALADGAAAQEAGRFRATA